MRTVGPPLCGRAESWTCISRQLDHQGSLLLAGPGCFAWTDVLLSVPEHYNSQTVLAAKPLLP